jgi:hypothetical protein
MVMSGQVRPDEAAGALADIRQRQGRVIDAVLVPHWYWWAVAAGMVAIGGAADTRRAPVLAVVIPVAAAFIAILTGAMIFGGYRRARVRGQDLLGDRGALAIVGFVGLAVGLTLGVAFALHAAGNRLPGTIATVVGGSAMAVGGPFLMRGLRQIMLSNRAGSSR